MIADFNNIMTLHDCTVLVYSFLPAYL